MTNPSTPEGERGETDLVERKVPEGSACPDCDGYGVVKSLHPDHAGIPCPHCDGTGDAFHPSAIVATPRTDAAEVGAVDAYRIGGMYVDADFARQLERECAKWKFIAAEKRKEVIAICESSQGIAERADTLTREAADLRRDIERHVEIASTEATRAEAALSELAEARRDGERAIQTIRDAWTSATDERWKRQKECEQEAWKWRDEGDMYGWNFHEGRASGLTEADIYYCRIQRALAAIDASL